MSIIRQDMMGLGLGILKADETSHIYDKEYLHLVYKVYKRRMNNITRY